MNVWNLFFKGNLKIQAVGEQMERFLNLCRNHEISFKNIDFINEKELHMIIPLKDFFKLKKICKKTKTHIKILKKRGMPFFFANKKKRKAFFLVLAVLIGTQFLYTTHIWEIKIKGNQYHTTPAVLSFLKEKEIYPGISKKNLNCSEIVHMLRKEYPEFTWASAAINNGTLLLTVKEEIIETQSFENEAPCSLISNQNGEIVKMITRSGVPQVKTGDICKIGDILVLGVVDIINDNQEIIRQEYVHADADIYIKRKIAYYKEYSSRVTAQIRKEEKRYGMFFKFGKVYLEICPFSSPKYHAVTEEQTVKLNESFILPFSYGRITLQQYKTVSLSYTQKQMEDTALEELYEYEKKLMQKGVQIFSNNVTIDFNHDKCITHGYLEIIEKTGTETSIQKHDSEIERITVNGK